MESLGIKALDIELLASVITIAGAITSYRVTSYKLSSYKLTSY